MFIKYKYNINILNNMSELNMSEIKNDQFPCIEMLPKGADYVEGIKTAIFQKDAIWPSGFNGRNRVTFGSQMCGGCSEDAAWSHIGKTCQTQDPSMNLGFIDPPLTEFTFNEKSYPLSLFKNATRNFYEGYESRWVPGATVIHEFCHSLGMLHEHQNNLFNSNSIKLDPTAVVNYYVGAGMSRQDAQVNVLDRYLCPNKDCVYEGSRFDPESIMLYALPDTWVVGKNPTKPNFKLSSTDKSWLRNEYPVDNVNMPILTYEFTDSDAPEWKQAWTIKTIIENLAPVVGIKFRFIYNNGIHFDVAPIQYPSFPLTLNDQPYETPVSNTNKPKFEYTKRCVKRDCDLKKKTCILECKITKKPIITHTLTDDSTMPSIMPSTMPSTMPEILEKFGNNVNIGLNNVNIGLNNLVDGLNDLNTKEPSKSKSKMIFYFVILFMLIALFCYIAFDTSK